jgi:putative SOS response-associated peptidase YedK
MCGRYSLSRDAEALARALGMPLLLKALDALRQAHPRPRYNIAPTQRAPVLLLASGTHPPEGLQVRPMAWGLIPSWAATPKGAAGGRINARAEGVQERPSFREAFQSRRALIPADGFFEWTPGPGARGRSPWWIHPKGGGLLTFAGLWERWTPPEGGDPLETFTILTTEAQGSMRALHTRMPVCVPPTLHPAWLEAGNEGPVFREVLEGARGEASTFHSYRVSPRVNTPRQDTPDLLEPVGPDTQEEEAQTSLFD